MKLWKRYAKALFQGLSRLLGGEKRYRGKKIPQMLRQPGVSLGQSGEQLARWYLTEVLGWQCVAQNARVHLSPTNHRIAGELDFVMREKKTGILVFVEVRTLAHISVKFGSPVDSVNRRKRIKVCRAARLWMKQNGISDLEPVRFDIVSIVWPSEGNPHIDHFPDAFPWTEPRWRKEV